jgi:starvation-inducible outer membrane lipoprotein
MAALLRIFLVSMVLTGCSSTVPVEIRDPLPGSPTLEQVQLQPELHKGQFVRWGGTIVAVRKEGDGVVAEVQISELNDYGRPQAPIEGAARFIVKIADVDATSYQIDRPLTVFGQVSGLEGGLSDPQVRLPLVLSNRAQLWEGARDYRYAAPYYSPRAHYYLYYHYPYYYWPYSYYPPFGYFPYRYYRRFGRRYYYPYDPFYWY